MEMRRVCLALIVAMGLCGWTGVRAQLAEDFSSGNLSTNGWQGDTAHFRITSSTAIPPALRPALQLYSTGSGNSMIQNFQPFRNMMEWSAWVKLSFNPSASNYSRFYIAGMSGFPANTDQSIFVGIGMVNDLAGLYQHDGNQIIPLIIDSSSVYNQSTNQLRVRVVAKNNWWYFETDPAGGDNLKIVDSIFLPVNFDTAFAAVFCQYTSSNATKMYFDDLYCGPLNIDTTPPSLLAASVTDPYQVVLSFSEPLHESVAANNTSFEADSGIGLPLLCFPDPSNFTTIILVFGEPFPEGEIFRLNIRGVTDRTGNLMNDTIISRLWYTAKRNDILINEVMADPTPPVKLPESEYIELHNRSLFTVSLCDWVLWIDNSRITLPCIALDPGSYSIIVNEKDTALWSGYQGVIPLPKLTLRNDGACLALQDFRGNIVHAICYDIKWHSNSFQSGGGYSLEMKDPSNPCDHSGTWSTTTDVSGGTPGARNSYQLPFPDLKAPYPLKVGVPNENLVSVTFSEPIDTLVNMLQLFQIEGWADCFSGFTLKTPLYDQITYHLLSPLKPDTVYYLIQTDTLRDCAGNYRTAAKIPFGIPALPDSLDLLFNEIMYRPAETGVEYIEIYNNSDKIIDLSMCLLARMDTLDLMVWDLYPLVDEVTLVFPGDYAVITKDVVKLLGRHHSADPSLVHLSSQMPALPDQGTTYALISQHGRIVDLMTYTPGNHAPGISDTKGISLERISATMPSTSAANWYSASHASGWGTPTKRNSQSAQAQVIHSTAEVIPPYFTPYCLRGSQLTYIHLNKLPPGTRVSIIIFDERGSPVKHLIRESIAGDADVYPWDGTNDTGTLCKGGVYLICIYLYHQQEGSQKFTLPVVLLSH